MPSISVIRVVATSVGVPPTAADGCSAVGQVERGPRRVRGVVDDAGDVGGQVHDVGQVQHERRLRHVHRRAVRCQRVGDRADGVLVLLEVLRRAGQGGGQRQVAGVVPGTSDGAGQHARGDQPALAADQHLRRRAEQPVDVERPAHRVARGQPAQRPAHVDVLCRRWRPGRGPARPSPGRRRRCGGPPRPPPPTHSVPLIAPSANVRRGARRGVGRVSSGAATGSLPTPIVVSQVVSPRRPTTTSGTTSTLSPGVVGEPERAEADHPGAGLVDLVADHGVADVLGPPLLGVGEPVGARGTAHGRDAPADQALAATYPGGGVGGVGQQREQRAGVVDPHGAHHERRGVGVASVAGPAGPARGAGGLSHAGSLRLGRDPRQAGRRHRLHRVTA